MKTPIRSVALMLLMFLVHGSLNAAVIEARAIFYNDSFWDTLSEDGAIATDKQALLPGQTSAFSNFTSYHRGINGVIVDIGGLTASPSLSDFVFRVGNSADVDTWIAAPDPLALSVRASAGVNGSDRLVFTWNDQAIRNQWLQVTALASLGLAKPDVFYFGNLVGDVNGDAFTSPLDVTILVNALNSQGGAHAVGIDDPLDVNRDGWVSPADTILVVSILNNFGPLSLTMFTAPPGSAQVPEPGMLFLLLSGLAGLAGRRRRINR